MTDAFERYIIKTESFGQRVKRLANKAGSITKLAKDTDIPISAIRSYIAEYSEPSRSRLIALAKGTESNLLWLMTGEGPIYGNRFHKYPILVELEEWLEYITEESPKWYGWLVIELRRKFPDFEEWRKEKKEKDKGYLF